MKKAFDQTVRDLKREVNKKVLKVPGVEQKILDATSNEPWGPHGSHLAEIAQATRNYQENQIIMHVIWKRINDTGKNWRHVYKALTVLEYLVGHGSERVIDEIREHAYQISTLSDFQYIDSRGRDQGNNVRRKSQSLVALVNDKERIQEVRQKALANRDKYRSTFSTGGRINSYSGGGGYGDRYDDDRYGSREDDRNGYGRERDSGGYKDEERYGRGGESYSRDGDRYGRDSDERFGRDSYRDDEYRGARSNDDYQFGPRNRSFDRDRDRSFEDDDRYSSPSGGGRIEDPSQDGRRLERKLSEQSDGAPPSYEEVVRDAHNNVHDTRDQGNLAAPTTNAFSPPVPKAASPVSGTLGPSHAVTGVSASAPSNEAEAFDEFDPRGSASAAPPVASGSEVDFFGTQSAADPVYSLALVPVASSTDAPTNSGFGMNFEASPSASMMPSQHSEDPFGDNPFKAIPQENTQSQQQSFAPATSFQAQQQSFAPATSFQAQQQGFAPATSFQPLSGSTGGAEPPPSATPKVEAAPTFDFGGTLGGLTYTPSVANGQQHTTANPPFTPTSQFPGTQGSYDVLGGILPPSGSAGFGPSQTAQQPPAYTNVQAANMSYLPQSRPSVPLASQAAFQPGPPINPQTAPMSTLPQPGVSAQPAPQVDLSAPGQPTKTQPSKDKFETKSTVWTDTLNRGLVNLNISGSKINPLANIGIDFDSINRMEKRKEKSTAAPVTSTTTMGKAMGSGSGIGRAGAGLAPQPNPIMGSGMGMGMNGAGGMGRGMGMGAGGAPGMGMGMGMGGYGGSMNRPMGMNMGMGMNMNMGMGQGPSVRPPVSGMPGVGYNPMGMNGYGSQQPYGGGYR